MGWDNTLIIPAEHFDPVPKQSSIRLRSRSLGSNQDIYRIYDKRLQLLVGEVGVSEIWCDVDYTGEIRVWYIIGDDGEPTQNPFDNQKTWVGWFVSGCLMDVQIR